AEIERAHRRAPRKTAPGPPAIRRGVCPQVDDQSTGSRNGSQTTGKKAAFRVLQIVFVDGRPFDTPTKVANTLASNWLMSACPMFATGIETSTYRREVDDAEYNDLFAGRMPPAPNPRDIPRGR